MAWNNIKVEKEQNIAILTINRPEVLNALNGETVEEIGEAMKQMETDPEVRAVIITGAGERSFVVGADIAFMNKLTPLEARSFIRQGHKILNRIENFPKPVIAAINGFALGGGCELAMSCDIRVASEKAKLGLPEVKLGVMPGFGGTQRLTRLVNPGLAKEILLTGDQCDAQTACRIGLVNHVAPSGQLLDFCRQMAVRIAVNGPLAVQLIKEAVNEGLEMDLDKALAHEADLFGVLYATEDRKEGMTAFLEKRQPVFRGL